MKIKCSILFVLIGFCIVSSSTAQRNVRPLKQIKVSVNKNIDVICTLNNQHATEFLKDSVDDPYLYKTTRLMRMNYLHFRSFTEHQAVQATRRLSDKIGTGVYLLGLFYDTLPKVKQIYSLSPVILREIHPNADTANQIVKDYFEQLAQFYYDTGYENYFQSNQPLYGLAIEEVRQNLPGNHFIPALEAYYGAHKDNYHLIIMPSFKSGWGLSWQITGDSGVSVYNIASPMGEQIVDQRQHIKDAGYNNPTEIRNLSVHEFSHSFVDQLTARSPYSQQIEHYKYLFTPIVNQAQYSDWHTLFNEHVVRAGEIRIALRMNNKQESRRLYNLYHDWVYLDHFLNQLKEYERNRKKYKRFEDYLPTLITSLATIKRK